MSNSSLIKDPTHTLIRKQVLETLTHFENFWLIYKAHSYGIAGLLDLNYKKSYIEILFHAPHNGKPLLEIFSPLVKELNFNSILEEPPMTSEGFVNPLETVKLVLDLANSTVQAYNFILRNEIRKLDEIFENYPIDGNPFHRRIFIYLPSLIFDLTIDFSKYPRRPIFTFSDALSSIVNVTDFMEQSALKQWDELNPVNIGYLLDILVQNVVKRTRQSEFTECSQQIIFENVQTSLEFQEFSFQIHRGQSLGVIINAQKSELEIHDFMLGIFRIIAGMQKQKHGDVEIFGSQTPLEHCSIVSQTLEPGIESVSVKKAILLNLDLHTSFKSMNIKELKKKVLDTTGLKNKSNRKLSELTIGERIRFNIGRAVLQAPQFILLILQEGFLNKFEIEHFSKYLINIKQEFHSIFIVSGLREIVSKCDKVLTISNTSSSTGFVDELVLQIPQAGEIITLEVNNPPYNILQSMLSIQNAQFIEERRNEKYKIYSEEDPDKLILKILYIIGPYLYNFKRNKPSLENYLQFKAIMDEK